MGRDALSASAPAGASSGASVGASLHNLLVNTTMCFLGLQGPLSAASSVPLVNASAASALSAVSAGQTIVIPLENRANQFFGRIGVS